MTKTAAVLVIGKVTLCRLQRMIFGVIDHASFDFLQKWKKRARWLVLY